MSWILAAIVSFASIALLMTHFSPRVMRRVAGYAMIVDIVLHGITTRPHAQGEHAC